MKNQDAIQKPELLIDKLLPDVREGLLFLCLLKEKINLPDLADLVSSHETIDELIRLPVTESDQEVVWIDHQDTKQLLLQFKWSEKVKAAEKLANYLDYKYAGSEHVGDLWLIAGKKEKALKHFLSAMNECRENQTYSENIRVCEKILKIKNLVPETELEVLHTLLLCQECCGELSKVIQTRINILEHPLIRETQEDYAAMMRALAIDYSKKGEWNQYKKFREGAAHLYQQLGNHEESSVDYIALSIRFSDELNLSKALEYAESAVIEAKVAGISETLPRAMAVKGYIIAMSGEYKAGQKLAKKALQFALKHSMLETAAFVYRKLAGTYEYASDFDQAKIIYDEAILFCKTEEMDEQIQMCYSCLSWIFLRLGEWKKAIELCTELVKSNLVNNTSKSTANCVVAIIKSLQGDIRTAEKHTREGIFLSQKEYFLFMYHLLHLPMAKINELKGNQEGAREWYCKIVDEWSLTREKHDVLFSMMEAALYFYEQNDANYLKKILEILAFISKDTGNTEALGCMAYVLGFDALVKKEFNSAHIHLNNALKYLSPLNIPYQVILVEYMIGISYLEDDQKDKGEQILWDMIPKAKTMGLKPLLKKISNALTRDQPQSLGYETLTSRQSDVLQLMAEGLSNKEIAARLHLSTRTVDMHIRYIFEKFHCHTRFEAIVIAKENGMIN